MAATPTTATDVRWLSDEEQLAWRRFVVGTRRLFDRLDADLKSQGLNHDDYGVLVALSEAPEDRMRMADLAAVSVESRSRLSHHVGRLEAKGLVERQNCSEDRRGSWAVLTPAGRAAIEGLAPHHVESVRRWFVDQLAPEELATLGEAMARVDAALGGTGIPSGCPDLTTP